MTAASFSLPEGELHVWRASLERPPEITDAFRAVLAPDERLRAERFYRSELGARYIVGRGLLRVLLGRYLDQPAEEIELDYGPNGKPRLRGPGPRFNLAHSEGEALLAFSSSAELGVDVELLGRRDRSIGRVAERFFAPEEVRTLRSLPAGEQPRAFLTCWTRKEAFIKARGDGLTLPLASFAVTLAPSDPPAVLRTAWSETEPAEWTVVDLSDERRGIVAAAAARHPGWRVVQLDADQLAASVA